ncbi:MAG: DNA (cytosine-5-)-methyltransferase, partial [Thermoanaerobaculia bacterium]|nr:DNA (cytosine-5-)-methyltransferase [Thermoanaerobaculia bacterium]
FFHLARIVEAKRPPVLFFENVKNLRSHDGGRTWEVIRSTLEGLRYRVFAQVIDAAHWLPQHRERVIIVGFDTDRFGEWVDFVFPDAPEKKHAIRDILEKQVDPKYTLTNKLWLYLQNYAKKHQEKGNGFGFGLVKLDGVARTLSARYFKDGSEILIPQRGKSPRRLTPRECARLMGFPDELPIVVSDTQAYKQFGNAVCPPVSEAVAKAVIPVLAAYLRENSLLVARK